MSGEPICDHGDVVDAAVAYADAYMAWLHASPCAEVCGECSACEAETAAHARVLDARERGLLPAVADYRARLRPRPKIAPAERERG